MIIELEEYRKKNLKFTSKGQVILGDINDIVKQLEKKREDALRGISFPTWRKDDEQK